jgi:hypothetical protein
MCCGSKTEQKGKSMKFKGLLLSSCILVAGSAQADDAEPFKTVSDEKKLRKLLTEHSQLKDPFTVQFRNVYVREVLPDTKGNPTKHIYCGELNAKNSYGGYTGWSRFVAHDVTDSPSVAVVDDEFGSIMVNLLCKDAPTG